MKLKEALRIEPVSALSLAQDFDPELTTLDTSCIGPALFALASMFDDSLQPDNVPTFLEIDKFQELGERSFVIGGTGLDDEPFEYFVHVLDEAEETPQMFKLVRIFGHMVDAEVAGTIEAAPTRMFRFNP